MCSQPKLSGAGPVIQPVDHVVELLSHHFRVVCHLLYTIVCQFFPFEITVLDEPLVPNNLDNTGCQTPADHLSCGFVHDVCLPLCNQILFYQILGLLYLHS